MDAAYIRIANVELVVVASVSGQVGGFHLDRVIDVTGSVGGTAALDHSKVGSPGDLEVYTYGGGRDGRHIRTMVVQWDVATVGGVAVHIVHHGRHTSPENDRGGQWIAGGNAVGEVELRAIESLARGVSCNGSTHCPTEAFAVQPVPHILLLTL